MTTTSTRIVFGLFDLAIKQDSTPSSTSDLQTFSKVDDLRTGNVERFPYATYEPDFWLLDGTYKFLPADDDAVHVGMMSLDMSDENGDFATPPVLTIDFGDAYSTDALTLRFSSITGDYANSINVQYNDGGGEIRQDDYTPTTPVFTTDQAVADFTQIVITFNSTNRPYRYLRVQGIDYGDVIEFTDADIQEAVIVEDVKPLSTELRSNTLDFTIYSESETFTPFNAVMVPTERQPIWVYETVDDAECFMGAFFLQSWKNISERLIEFHCVDYIGLLDAVPCDGGIWSATSVDIIDLLTDLLGDENIPFDLDSTLFPLDVRGWLPICTLREALQLIAFAVGSAVDCSRSHTIRIYPIWHLDPIYPTLKTASHITLTDAAKSLDEDVELGPIIQTERNRTVYNASTSEQLTVVDATLAAGTYRQDFDQPLHTLAATGATITDSGANYATFTVASGGPVTLTGYTYRTHLWLRSYGTEGQLLRITDAPLYCTHLGAFADLVMEYLLWEYYNLRYHQKVTLYAPRLEVPDVVVLDSWFGEQILAVVERLHIDLVRGMVVEAETRGKQVT